MATTNPLRNVQTYIKLPLLYDHWYVAGMTGEFDEGLTAKTLLERSIVFYRKQGGGLVALQNRCAHRSFPLAQGRLEGDNLRCGYHGILYGPDGNIIDVPCQSTCPKAGVRNYAVVEQGPFVWIWMGDTERADKSLIPQTDCLTDPTWAAMFGAKHLEGNYLLMHENLADLSHLPFLHAKTFGASGDWAEIPVQVEKENDQVHYWRETDKWEMAAPLYPPSVDCSERPIDAKLGATFVSPAMCRGWTRVEILDSSNGEQKTLENEINHYLTPETHDTAHYYWSFARNCDIDNAAFSGLFEQVVSAAFDEDRTATRQMQAVLDEDRHEITDINIAGDKSSVMVRKLILDMSEREHGPRSVSK